MFRHDRSLDSDDLGCGEAFGRALDLLLEHRIPDADPVDGGSVFGQDRYDLAVLRARLRGDSLRKITRGAL